MLRLIVMRHAEARGAGAGEADIDRRLSAAGQAQARRIGRLLAEAGLAPDRALVSAAQRTRETWDLAHEAFGDVEVEFDPAIYNAGSRELRRAVEAAEDRCGALLVLGHNPAVHQLAHDLLVEGAAAPAVQDRLASGFPPASAAVFEFDAAGRPSLYGVFGPGAIGGE
ncbi:MAG TPA: histidine phosphatase family protein [Caulobacteraceae bacterium]|jgi:phosphohistidine phosphatase